MASMSSSYFTSAPAENACDLLAASVAFASTLPTAVGQSLARTSQATLRILEDSCRQREHQQLQQSMQREQFGAAIVGSDCSHASTLTSPAMEIRRRVGSPPPPAASGGKTRAGSSSPGPLSARQVAKPSTIEDIKLRMSKPRTSVPSGMSAHACMGGGASPSQPVVRRNSASGFASTQSTPVLTPRPRRVLPVRSVAAPQTGCPNAGTTPAVASSGVSVVGLGPAVSDSEIPSLSSSQSFNSRSQGVMQHDVPSAAAACAANEAAPVAGFAATPRGCGPVPRRCGISPRPTFAPLRNPSEGGPLLASVPRGLAKTASETGTHCIWRGNAEELGSSASDADVGRSSVPLQRSVVSGKSPLRDAMAPLQTQVVEQPKPIQRGRSPGANASLRSHTEKVVLPVKRGVILPRDTGKMPASPDICSDTASHYSAAPLLAQTGRSGILSPKPASRKMSSDTVAALATEYLQLCERSDAALGELRHQASPLHRIVGSGSTPVLQGRGRKDGTPDRSWRNSCHSKETTPERNWRSGIGVVGANGVGPNIRTGANKDPTLERNWRTSVNVGKPAPAAERMGRLGAGGLGGKEDTSERSGRTSVHGSTKDLTPERSWRASLNTSRDAIGPSAGPLCDGGSSRAAGGSPLRGTFGASSGASITSLAGAAQPNRGPLGVTPNRRRFSAPTSDGTAGASSAEVGIVTRQASKEDSLAMSSLVVKGFLSTIPRPWQHGGGAADDDMAYVQRLFSSQLPSARVLSVHRVENPGLGVVYGAVRETMGANKGERVLWHGTSADSLRNITLNGFNRAYCGRHGLKYGHGTYFSSNADYSVRFCDRRRSTRIMFLAKVLVGDWTRGSPELLEPPHKDTEGLARFDSTVDDVQSPSIFCVFKDFQAIPLYLVEFGAS
eukprot:TRINITY_DN2847_c0_g3_i1.p1 TRINITY_DN2847_c0_g3~~TRINITY_DN2847_c0_g3_i1.p1  ORF type:complete len:1015 (-),score=110.30 TRINITY_DN2847_c0_g3_i1:167-2860(-)